MDFVPTLLIAVIFLVIVINQASRIKKLEQQVMMLFMKLNESKKDKQDTSAIPEKKKESISEMPVITPVREEPPLKKDADAPFIKETRKEEIPPPPDDSTKQLFTPKPPRTNAEWEALIGGKILNRIGALALIIGTGFFLKYAVDNDWITETMRVAIGFTLGVVLLFGGHFYQRNNFRVFSQGLVGAGIAILYLSAYASFNYYHLVSQTIAVLLMSLVTVITFWQAFKYDSLVIGMFGWVGGFLTPILLSTGSANETGLFTYLALLDSGLLLIVLRKEKWFVLEPLTLGATVLMYVAWNINDYSEDKLWLTIFFLLLFWGLFLSVELIRIYRSEKKILNVHQLVSTGNGAFLFIAVLSVLVPHYSWMATSSVILAAIYFGVYLLVKSRRPEDQLLLIRYLLSAILLTVIASAIQFDDFEITIAWAVESLALALLAARFRNTILWWSSMALLGLSFLNFKLSPDAFQIKPAAFHLLMNMRALALIVMILSAAVSIFLSRRIENRNPQVIHASFTYAAIAFFFLLVTLETRDYFGQLSFMHQHSQSNFFDHNLVFVLSLEWMIMATPSIFFGVRIKNESLRIAGLILAGIAVPYCAVGALSFYSPMESFIPVFNIRALTLLFTASCLFFQTQWLEKENFYSWTGTLVNVMRVMMVTVGFVLLTVEVRDIFQKKILSAYQMNKQDIEQLKTNYKNLQQLCMSGAWLFYSMLLMVIGIYRSRLNIRIMSIAVFGITIAKVFFYDLSYLDTLHRIISFIALGVILLLVSYLYQKFKHLILPPKETGS